jgi:glutathione peroxidase
MKAIIISILALVHAAGNMYGVDITKLGGGKMELDKYKGKAVLVVNIATQCGYTGQLDGLQKLYDKYKSKGLVVLGVPSNDFGGQTPEDEAGVSKFCKLNYGVEFPLTQKAVVKGPEKHALIKVLMDSAADKNEIKWNFEKFLVSKEGKVLSRYGSGTKPDDKDLSKAIEAAL